MLRVAAAALGLLLIGCASRPETPQRVMLTMQANGDFQGCLNVALSQIETAKATGNTSTLATDYFYAAECNEALGHRVAALDNYIASRRTRETSNKSAERIAALNRGGPLRTASDIQAESAGIIAPSTTVADDDDSGSRVTQAAMLGILNQPTYSVGRRTAVVTPSRSTASGFEPSQRSSGSQGRCPPPTVSRDRDDGESNRTWIRVTSNCTHTVTVVIHTVNLYQTQPRTERTQPVQIGSTAAFSCDGKRQGCVVEMVGYH